MRRKALNTLKKRAEFQKVRGGARWSTASFAIEAKVRAPGATAPELEQHGGPRFGLTITKKVGNAVERNRIRRRLKSILTAASAGARPDTDYVLIARRAALDCDYAALEADVVTALQRVASPKATKRR